MVEAKASASQPSPAGVELPGYPGKHRDAGGRRWKSEGNQVDLLHAASNLSRRPRAPLLCEPSPPSPRVWNCVASAKEFPCDDWYETPSGMYAPPLNAATQHSSEDSDAS